MGFHLERTVVEWRVSRWLWRKWLPVRIPGRVNQAVKGYLFSNHAKKMNVFRL